MASIPSKKLLEMFRYLLLTRRLEDRVAYLCHNQDPREPLVIGKGYLSTGQEAISVGAASTLEEGDWLAPSHRDLGACLVRGVTASEIFLQYFCRIGSHTRGRDGNVHFGDLRRRIVAFVSHMGSLTPVANGIAWAMKYRGTPNVVLSFFGDGASSQGIVHEALNYAGVFKLPVVFVINNNRYAISTPYHEQTAAERLSLRATGYGMPGTTIDGNDLLAVYGTVQEALDRARQGEGPSLIECETMRMSGHGTHDVASYVPREVLEEWKKRDPIVRFRNLLKERGILPEAKEKEIEGEVAKEIDEAVEAARSAPTPQPEDLLR